MSDFYFLKRMLDRRGIDFRVVSKVPFYPIRYYPIIKLTKEQLSFYFNESGDLSYLLGDKG
jgi:hypothetical protein